MNRLKFLALTLALVAPPLPPVLAQANVPGDWNLTLATPLGSYVVMLTLEQDGDKVTGHLTSPASPVPIAGTVKGNELNVTATLVLQAGELDFDLNGIVTGDQWKGTVKYGAFGTFPFTGRRADQSADAAQTPPEPGAAPALASAVPGTGPADITGKWNIVVKVGAMGELSMSATVQQDGEKVTGTVTSPFGEAPVNGTMSGNALLVVFTTPTPQGNIDVTLTGQLGASGFVGKASIAGMGDADWTASRAPQ